MSANAPTVNAMFERAPQMTSSTRQSGTGLARVGLGGPAAQILDTPPYGATPTRTPRSPRERAGSRVLGRAGQL